MTKLIEISELTKEIIPDGAVIAIGGVHSHNVPMSLVRQIIRLGSKDLTLIGSISAGLPVDILVGAGLVKTVLAPYVGFEMWGLAPQFRKAVQNKSIYAPDVCEAFPVYSLRAAANGIPFHPFPEGIHVYSDIHKQSDLYQIVKDPFSDKEVSAIKAIRPDIALIHVQYATDDGNCIHQGSVVTDRLMAAASKFVIVSTEKIISQKDLQQRQNDTTIPSFYVNKVIHLPKGAFPTSSHGYYMYDVVEIKDYLKACRDEKSYKDYLQGLGDDEIDYLKGKIVAKRHFPTTDQVDTDTPYTISELIVCVFARDIRDGELGICGAVSDIPMAAMKLAEQLHAPSMKWIAGGSGYVNPRGPLLPSSTDYEMCIGAEVRLSMNDVIPIEMQNLDFFFAGGLQIDARGNTNLAGIRVDDTWKLRGPGSVGLAFLTRAKRVYLYTLTHNSRVLVDKVNYISGPGHPKDGNQFGGGPTLLVTNLCVFSWNLDKDKWELKSIHPKITLEQVIESTGFDFIHNENIPTTSPPTDKELHALRKIDIWGYLHGNSE